MRLLLEQRQYKFAVLVSALLACQLQIQPLYAESAKALRLDQTHAFFGRCRLTVAENGIRIENISQLKFVLVAKAPDWKVTVYRIDDKACFSQTLKDFCRSGMISGFILPVPDHYLGPKVLTRSKAKFSGFDVTCLTTNRSIFKYLERGKIAPQVEEILLAAYKTPTNGGIPVYYKKRSSQRDYYSDIPKGSHVDTLIDTTKIETVACDGKQFLAPVGFKSIKSIQEIVTGTGAKTKTADFQELFEMKSMGSKRR